MVFGQVVIGPPGSGKTTYCHGMGQFLSQLGRKVAIVNLDKALEDEGLESAIVLQVHDEIIVEAPEAEVEQASELMTSTMREAYELRVPLEIDLQVADTWADAKG